MSGIAECKKLTIVLAEEGAEHWPKRHIETIEFDIQPGKTEYVYRIRMSETLSINTGNMLVVRAAVE